MIWQLLTTYLFFSLSLISVRSLMHYFSASELTAIRLTASGFILVIIGLFFSKKETWRQFFSAKVLGGLAFLAIGNTFGINILLSQALAATSAAVVGLLYNTNPLMVATIASFLGIEHLTQRKIFSIMVGFIGLVVIMLPELLKNGSLNNGQVYALTAAVLAAVSAIIMKKMSHTLDKSGGFLLIGLTMVLGGSVSFLIKPHAISLVFTHIPLMLFAIVTTALAAICYYFMIASYSASLVTMASFITPLYLAIFEFILYGQIPALSTLLGGCIVLIALHYYVE